MTRIKRVSLPPSRTASERTYGDTYAKEIWRKWNLKDLWRLAGLVIGSGRGGGRDGAGGADRLERLHDQHAAHDPLQQVHGEPAPEVGDFLASQVALVDPVLDEAVEEETQPA